MTDTTFPPQAAYPALPSGHGAIVLHLQGHIDAIQKMFRGTAAIEELVTEERRKPPLEIIERRKKLEAVGLDPDEYLPIKKATPLDYLGQMHFDVDSLRPWLEFYQIDNIDGILADLRPNPVGLKEYMATYLAELNEMTNG